MLSTGDVINERYKVTELIARGGMGEVWKANDEVLGRPVAMKTVNPEYLATNPKALSILKDEAKMSARLIGHPNIVCTLDLGEFKDKETPTHFIVMEYVQGPSIARWIEETSAKLDNVTNFNINLLIAWELCKALGYAHREGILHRDIKPLNVFVSNYGTTKVGDFGLARFIEAITRTHTVWRAMSPAYAAPEQWRSRKHTLDTEVYQLGCTLYHILTRRLPFNNPGLLALMNAHLKEDPKPPIRIMTCIPKSISDAILRALQKKPKDRIELWRLYDTIAEKIRSKYIMKVDVHESPKKVRDLVAEITDFSEKGLAEGPFEFTFPDFSEVLSESIQLVLSGITTFKVRQVK